MGTIQGNYITDKPASGGVCLVCGGFFAWEALSTEERGVCLECAAHSEHIMRGKMVMEEVSRITLDYVKEQIIGSDCLNSPSDRPDFWKK
jgi:hypothetical protein